MERRLNVGCGPDIRPNSEGWVNMDITPLEGVDVVHNAMEFPWPLEDESFDHVYCSHFMEHVPHTVPGHAKDGFVLVMEEFHRILKPGGTVEIRSPHPESVDRWADPTHTRVVHPKNFRYFEPDSGWGYYTTAKFRTREMDVTVHTAVAPDFLPMGASGLGITQHLAERVRPLERLLKRQPWELKVVLEKV